MKKYLLTFVFTAIFTGGLSAQWEVAGMVNAVDSNILLEIRECGNGYERVLLDTAFAGYLDGIITACTSDYFGGKAPSVEAEQLKAYIADSTLSNALQLLAWADSSRIKQCFPNEFNEAKKRYNMSLLAVDAKKWEDAITNANSAIQLLVNLAEPSGDTYTGGQYPPRIFVIVPGASPSVYR
jgi:hypothetical protein